MIKKFIKKNTTLLMFISIVPWAMISNAILSAFCEPMDPLFVIIGLPLLLIQLTALILLIICLKDIYNE